MEFKSVEKIAEGIAAYEFEIGVAKFGSDRMDWHFLTPLGEEKSPCTFIQVGILKPQ